MLGSQLVESGLISYEALETANEKFLDALHGSDTRNANLLRILLAETKALSEVDLVDAQVDDHHLSPCSLERIEFNPSEWDEVDVDACYATRTLPIDQVDEVIFLATSCYLSRPVREYWEAQYGNDMIVWFVAPFAQIEERLRMVSDTRAAQMQQADTIDAGKKTAF